MRLFGRSKKKEVEGPQESIVQMRATLEMLEKKEKHLETKIAAETNTARQYAVSNKSSNRRRGPWQDMLLTHPTLL